MQQRLARCAPAHFAVEADEPAAEADDEEDLRIAIVGRPNVGKSTLANRLLGEERLVVFDLPGTTRDTVEVPFERNDRKYVLIDTAGMVERYRRRYGLDKEPEAEAENPR